MNIIKRIRSWSIPRKQILAWSIWFALFNILVLTIISTRLLAFIPRPEGILAAIYLPLALIGHFTFLTGLPLLLIIVPLLLIWPNRALIWSLALIFGTVGLVLLWLDTVIYAQYRLHLSGFVFNLMWYGGGEIFSFSWMTWLISIGIILGAITLESLAARFIYARLLPRGQNHYAGLILAAGLTAFLASQLIHAWAEATYFQPVTTLTRHIPLYYPLKATRFFKEHGWIDDAREREDRVLDTDARHRGDIHYPLAKIKCRPPEVRSNLLVIVIDAWRFDMLLEEVTPNTCRFSTGESVWKFHDHYSGGNSTQSGIFTLFYGLPGTYWTGMESNQIGPALIHEMLRRDYQTGIFASAKLTKPDFDRTVFSEITNLRLGSGRGRPYYRDRLITDEWIKWLDRRDDTRPFFGFLFYDSARGSSFPPNYPPLFEPIWDRVDHLALNNDFDPAPYFNRYKRALHYIDSLVGKVLADLEQRGLLDKTVIVITSDHGEEFNDNRRNYWGHGGNYTRYQTQVPLVIRWPGKEAADFTHKTTHFDIAPTLMTDLFGCVNDCSDYSSGRHLLDKSGRFWLIIASYYNYGIIYDGRAVVTYPAGMYEIFDETGGPVKNAGLPRDITAAALKEMARFYR